MITIKIEAIRPFDVDSTLVYPNAPGTENMPTVDVLDPVSNEKILLRYNPNMARLLQEEHQRKSFVIVWSRSGWEWAHNCVVALGLEEYVDQVMSKPTAYFDDSPVEQWLKDRVFIEPNVVYKR